MRLGATKSSATSFYNGLGNQLWDLGGARPSLDLNFAGNKNLSDSISTNNLVTFTRASSGTYVDSQGVIRTATTNLLLRSEEFDNAYWTKFATTVSINTSSSPTGSATADSIVESATTAQHGLQAVSAFTPIATTAYIGSVYAKASERTLINVYWSSGFNGLEIGAYFNLSSGLTYSASAGVTASIVSSGNGWYRCSISAVSGASPGLTNFGVRLVSSGTSLSYTGDGTSGIYIWGAQLEQSSTVGEYIPTTSTINSAPRFDHNPTTGESLGLLVEEQRTNLLLRSEEFDNAAWITANGGYGANAATSPTGTLTADKLIINNGVANCNAYQSATITSGATVTGSVFVKADGSDRVEIVLLGAGNATPYGRASFSAATGAVTTAVTTANGGTNASTATTAHANGWYRVSVTVTYPATTAAGMRILVFNSDSSNGDGAKGVLLWGAQLEAGSFPTSYIPTTTAAVTRSADVASITGSNFSSWYRQDEGTVFAETQLYSTFTRNAAGFDINDNSTNNRVIFRAFTTGSFDQYTVRSGGSTEVQIASAGTPSTTIRKSAVTISLNSYAISANGASPTEDTSGALPISVSQLLVGSAQAGTEFMGGTIRRLTYWPQRLPNTTLQQITQ